MSSPAVPSGSSSILVVHHARLKALEHRAHQARLLVRRGGAEHEIGLGRTPAVDQANAGAAREFAMELRGHAGRERDARGVGALLRAFRPRQQDRDHGPEHVRDRGAMSRQRRKKIGGREALLVAHRRTGQERLTECVDRIGVKQRQAGAQDVVALDLEQRRAVDAPPEILRVRAADALRRAGRARGVEDHPQVGGLERCRPDRLLLLRHRGGDNVAEAERSRGADGPDRFERQRARLEHGQVLEMVRLDHQQPRAAVRQHVLELRAA